MAECRLLVNVYWLQGKKKAPAERPTVLIAMAERYAISNVKTLMKSCFSMVMYILICMSRSRVDHDTNALKKKMYVSRVCMTKSLRDTLTRRDFALKLQPSFV